MWVKIHGDKLSNDQAEDWGSQEKISGRKWRESSSEYVYGVTERGDTLPPQYPEPHMQTLAYEWKDKNV